MLAGSDSAASGRFSRADARASTDTIVAQIDRDRFLFVVKSNPPFALTVMSHLADRIRRGW